MARYSVKLQLSSIPAEFSLTDVVTQVSLISGVEAESVVTYVSKTDPKNVSVSFKVATPETDAILLKRLSLQLQSPFLNTLSLSVAQEL